MFQEEVPWEYPDTVDYEGSIPLRSPGYVTKFAANKALKLIPGYKLTFDETFVIQRVLP
jgi:hypothetical protein